MRLKVRRVVELLNCSKYKLQTQLQLGSTPPFSALMTSDLTPETLEAHLREMTACLLVRARAMTYNTLAEDCRYILSEIAGNQSIITERDRFAWLNQQRLVPHRLAVIMPEVLRRYDNFYDINLCIHQAYRQVTIVDIRYYPKSSLPADYRQRVAQQAPMLHAKVALLWYEVDKSGHKFDINWKPYAPISPARHRALLLKWRLLTYLHQLSS